MRIVTAAQMQQVDHRAMVEEHIPGLVLMEQAGICVVAAMENLFGPLAGKQVTIVCGKGNNGGDGMVVARRITQHRAKPRVILMAKTTALSKDANTMYRRCLKTVGKASIRICPDPGQLQRLLQESDLLVDALLGTGLSSAVSGPLLAVIDAMNQSGKPITCVDVPSGLHADSGAMMGQAVRGSLTVTFGLPKLGLYLGAGIDYSGKIHIADIGFPPHLLETVHSHVFLVTPTLAQANLPPRPASGHKGTFGHVGLIAGSVGKTGAAALAAKAALRTGAGLVTVAIPASVNDVLESKLLEVMTTPMPETSARTLAPDAFNDLVEFSKARSAIGIGPGLSTHPKTVELIRTFLPHIDQPCIIDADALNALAGHTYLLSKMKMPKILTPHPGEMARLVGDTTGRLINTTRMEHARQFSCDHQSVLVLKGANTVIANPNGEVGICPTGNSGMATAGSGDVLTGIIASLLAQGVAAWESAVAGVYFHGLAGDLALQDLGSRGMLAGDILERIPDAINHAC